MNKNESAFSKFVCDSCKTVYSNEKEFKKLCENCKQNFHFRVLLEKLETLEVKVDKIKENTDKMSEHINFVNETYETLKTPLNILKSTVERLIPNQRSLEN